MALFLFVEPWDQLFVWDKHRTWFDGIMAGLGNRTLTRDRDFYCIMYKTKTKRAVSTHPSDPAQPSLSNRQLATPSASSPSHQLAPDLLPSS